MKRLQIADCGLRIGLPQSDRQTFKRSLFGESEKLQIETSSRYVFDELAAVLWNPRRA